MTEPVDVDRLLWSDNDHGPYVACLEIVTRGYSGTREVGEVMIRLCELYRSDVDIDCDFIAVRAMEASTVLRPLDSDWLSAAIDAVCKIHFSTEGPEDGYMLTRDAMSLLVEHFGAASVFECFRQFAEGRGGFWVHELIHSMYVPFLAHGHQLYLALLESTDPRARRFILIDLLRAENRCFSEQHEFDIAKFPPKLRSPEVIESARASQDRANELAGVIRQHLDRAHPELIAEAARLDKEQLDTVESSLWQS